MANISTIKVGSTSYGIEPASHASTATTYGAATASNYGHVKLSDNYTSSAGAAASGIAASSAAVYNAYNTLNSNLSDKARIYQFNVSTTPGNSNSTPVNKYITSKNSNELPACLFVIAGQGPSGIYIGSTFMTYPFIQQMTSSINWVSIKTISESKTNLVITKLGTNLITVNLITNEEIVISDSPI